MIDADELLSKADALLARWRSGAVVPRPPADYPILTEVVRISVANSDTPMPEIPVEPAMPLLDASAAAAGAAAPMEIPVLESPDTPTFDSPSAVATGDPVLSVLDAADELPRLPPLEAPTAAADAGARALEDRVLLRVLEAIEPLFGALLEEPLRLRTEELARRLATIVARDARNDILTLVRAAVKRAVAYELKARRDE